MMGCPFIDVVRSLSLAVRDFDFRKGRAKMRETQRDESKPHRLHAKKIWSDVTRSKCVFAELLLK